jgi:hypothetical protein
MSAHKLRSRFAVALPGDQGQLVMAERCYMHCPPEMLGMVLH